MDVLRGFGMARGARGSARAPIKIWKFAKKCLFLLILTKSSEISSAQRARKCARAKNFSRNEISGKNRCVLHHKRMQNLQNSYLKWKSPAISQGAIYEMAWGSNSTLKPTSKYFSDWLTVLQNIQCYCEDKKTASFDDFSNGSTRFYSTDFIIIDKTTFYVQS